MRLDDRSRTKRIIIDILGYLLILISGLIGWLPGPGGIPPLILGLSLLATNHEWAERILIAVKNHGVKISDRIFDGSPRTKAIVDIIGILLVIAGVLIMTLITRSVVRTAAISLIVASVLLLLGNRKRIHRLKKHISNKNT